MTLYIFESSAYKYISDPGYFNTKKAIKINPLLCYLGLQEPHVFQNNNLRFQNYAPRIYVFLGYTDEKYTF